MGLVRTDFVDEVVEIFNSLFVLLLIPYDQERTKGWPMLLEIFFMHDCTISYSGLSLNSAGVQIMCFLPHPFGVGYGGTMTD